MGLDSRLRARSGQALKVHWTFIHYLPFESLEKKKASDFHQMLLADPKGFDSRLRARSGSALTVHRTVIHYRPFEPFR